MTLTTEERAELDGLKATVKQLQTQLAAKTVAPLTETAPPITVPYAVGGMGVQFENGQWGRLPIQTAPVPPPESDVVVTSKKTTGPVGKATQEQAFQDPEGRSFDDNATPSIVPAR